MEFGPRRIDRIVHCGHVSAFGKKIFRSPIRIIMSKIAQFPLVLLFAIALPFLSGCAGQSTETTDTAEPPVTKEVVTPTPELTVQTVPEPVPPKEMKVDVSEALELMQEEPELQLLDVRTPAEVAGGIIKGAKVINIKDADFLTKAAAQLDKTKPILVYCASGKRSSSAIAQMKDNGFTMLYNLDGGITAWVAEGQEVVK
jgi:rhodanese-related sulfurtransferase